MSCSKIPLINEYNTMRDMYKIYYWLMYFLNTTQQLNYNIKSLLNTIMCNNYRTYYNISTVYNILNTYTFCFFDLHQFNIDNRIDNNDTNKIKSQLIIYESTNDPKQPYKYLPNNINVSSIISLEKMISKYGSDLVIKKLSKNNLKQFFDIIGKSETLPIAKKYLKYKNKYVDLKNNIKKFYKL